MDIHVLMGGYKKYKMGPKRPKKKGMKGANAEAD
jgi:hypothetical protein